MGLKVGGLSCESVGVLSRMTAISAAMFNGDSHCRCVQNIHSCFYLISGFNGTEHFNLQIYLLSVLRYFQVLFLNVIEDSCMNGIKNLARYFSET